MDNVHSASETGGEEKIPATIHRAKLIGVGDVGCGVLDYLVLQGYDELDLVAMNTEARVLEGLVVRNKLQIGSKLLHGLSAGGDPFVGRQAAMLSEIEISKVLDTADAVIIVAGMGGGTGSGVAPVVAEMARMRGLLCFGLLITPFPFEGARRYEQAMIALSEMRKVCHASFTFSCERLQSSMDGGTTVLDIFSKAIELAGECAWGLGQILTQRGLIQLEPIDVLKAIASNGDVMGSSSVFGWGEGSGNNRIDAAIKQLMDGPLFSDLGVRSQVEEVLLTITGGHGLTLIEIQQATYFLKQQLSPQIHIQLGTILDNRYENRIRLMVMGGKKTVESEIMETVFSVSTGEETTPADGVGFLATSSVESEEDIFTSEAAIEKESKQGSFTFELPTRGRFDKTDVTLYKGEDLDIPTYLRRGVKIRRVPERML